MATEADPVVGTWYRHLDKGQEFEVVAVNEDENIVEVQHFDGDVEEFDLEQWYDLDIEPTETPENWSGPYDMGEPDDLAPRDTEMQPEDWEAPTTEVHTDND